MNYFTKLKKRIHFSKTPPQPSINNTQLGRFHECWEYVHNVIVTRDTVIHIHVKHTQIPEKLREMVDLLVNEEEAGQEDNSTGNCMEYFLKHGVLQCLVKQTETVDYPQGIRLETVRMITLMIDLLNDRFLIHNAIHIPTIKLLQSCIDQDELLYLMYIICTKIHGFPDLLHIFFHDKQWLTTPQKNNQSSTPEYEFLLFTYMVRYIHCDGKSGEFARKGVLLIMDMATDQLKEFILGSEFVVVVANGLAGCYSQLPKKLCIQQEPGINDTTASFLLRQDVPPQHSDMEYSNSDRFQQSIDLFLKVLEFCQDLCQRYSFIQQQLLLCVEILFLEDTLYPTLLECSDSDGSSVAVLSYINVILQMIQQKDMVDTFIQFLMGQHDDNINKTKFQLFKKNTTSITNVEHYSLKDLIFDGLKSISQPTVLATLKLLKTIITQHCKYTDHLLSYNKDELLSSTDGTCDMKLYFNLIGAMNRLHVEETFLLGYEEYYSDIEQAIHQSCTDKVYRRIQPNDPLIQLLSYLLSQFFSQSSELNLALTGVVTALAMCPLRSLEGWILVSEGEKFPALYMLLEALTRQVNYYRSMVDDFDVLLDERWNGLLFGELNNITACDASSSSSSLSSSSSSSQSMRFESSRSPDFLCSGIKSSSTVITAKITATSSFVTNDVESITSSTSSTVLSIVRPDSALTAHAQKTLAIHVTPVSPSRFSTDISLSSVLNNVIILEEVIKEIVAIIQVRE